MISNAPHARRLALVGAVAALALTGCPSPSIYGTARTIPRGQIQQTVAVEGLGATTSGASGFVPTLPTYQFRIGLADNVDLGLRVPNLTSVGADVKINLLRGSFDLAVDPSIQGIYAGVSDVNVGLLWLHAPVILGFNLTQNFSIIATPGISYGVYFAGDSTSSSSSSRTAYSTGGFAGRLGVGFNIRVANTFSIQPEITALYNFNAEGVLYIAGVGFEFGAHPDYSDIR